MWKPVIKIEYEFGCLQLQEIRSAIAEIAGNVEFVLAELPKFKFAVPRQERQVYDVFFAFRGTVYDLRTEARNLQDKLGMNAGQAPYDEAIKNFDPRVTLRFLEDWLSSDIDGLWALVLSLQECRSKPYAHSKMNLLETLVTGIRWQYASRDKPAASNYQGYTEAIKPQIEAALASGTIENVPHTRSEAGSANASGSMHDRFISRKGITMSNLARAIAIASLAHEKQLDKAGAPYVLHPLRIMMRMQTDDERIVGVLHDVVEDGPGWSFERLREEGFSEAVVQALECVTKRPEEQDDYDAFITRAATNPLARRVKLADLEDNLDLRRIASLTVKDLKRTEKYHRAWVKLNSSRQ